MPALNAAKRETGSSFASGRARRPTRAPEVDKILETEATGAIADIYSDIRNVLGASAVNLIWRNLATMPGAMHQ